jgi:hypothetical protein
MPLTYEDVRAAELDAARLELQAIEGELARRRWLDDPEAWIDARLEDDLWSRQRTILRAIRDHRRVAVPSCHEVSKTFTAARIAAWWLDTHLPGEAFVVTTASTDSQVRAVLWREIGRVHAKGKLRGRVNQTEWHLKMPDGNEEMIAFGRKPSDYNPTAFQGIHARYVLFIGDEASGIARALFDAADTLIANDNSKVLLMGNPDDPQSHFAEVCKPGSGWFVVPISAFDSPNFTGEPLSEHVKQHLIGRTYVEERRKKWAPMWRWTEDGTKCVPPPNQKVEDSHPLWQSKVLGRFPKISGENALIPWAWIKQAQEKVIRSDAPATLGVDVGGGSDENTGVHNRGGRIRVLWSDQNPDTMQTCGNMVSWLKNPDLYIAEAHVDEIGIGKGMADRANELYRLGELAIPVYGINVSEVPIDTEHYINRRAEDYWTLRTAFERGEIDLDPEDEETAAELVSIRYRRLSNGKIQIESKLEMKARGLPSPNRADGCMLSIAKPRAGYGPLSVVTLAGFG